MGCYFLLQGIFPTHGSNLGLLHCKQVLLPSEPRGKPTPLAVREMQVKTSEITLHSIRMCVMYVMYVHVTSADENVEKLELSYTVC